jgi:hypothetical protein
VLVASGLWLNQNHGGVRGVVVFGGFAVAAAWLEYFPGGIAGVVGVRLQLPRPSSAVDPRTS